MVGGAFRAIATALSAMALSTSVNGYWLMGGDFITTERLDPIVNPGTVSGHVHSVVGGSNFGFEATTDLLQKSQCTSVPIKEDKSNYWFPHLYFQWANGSFSSVDGGAVIYYLFPDKAGTTKAFPPNFRMISGNPRKRSHDGSSAAKAVDFLCLDFQGKTTKHSGLPEKVCPSGIRSQVNFPSCWNGKDVDSPDHKSHVAYRSNGPDSGECNDPNFPVSIPRIFLEVYWGTGHWNQYASQAKKPSQPFVFAYGDNTGFGNHADFYNGWDDGVLQKAVDGCNCDMYGSPQCCANKGIFTLTKDQRCRITKQVDETTTGWLPTLPGNNPVQGGPGDATMMSSNIIPGKIAPAYVYTGDRPTQVGSVVTPPTTIGGGNPRPSSSSAAPVSPSSSSSPAAAPSTSSTSSSSTISSSSSPVAELPNHTSSSADVTSTVIEAPLPTSSSTAESSTSSSSSVIESASPTATPAPTAPGHPVITRQPLQSSSSSSSSSAETPVPTTPGHPVITRQPTPTSSSSSSADNVSVSISVSVVTRTYISTRWLRPTADCGNRNVSPADLVAKVQKAALSSSGHKRHMDAHHRSSAGLRKRYDFDADDYYYII